MIHNIDAYCEEFRLTTDFTCEDFESFPDIAEDLYLIVREDFELGLIKIDFDDAFSYQYNLRKATEEIYEHLKQLYQNDKPRGADIVILDHATSSVYLFKRVVLPKNCQTEDIERILQGEGYHLDEINYMVAEDIRIMWGSKEIKKEL